jgi:hypothetical protein
LNKPLEQSLIKLNFNNDLKIYFNQTDLVNIKSGNGIRIKDDLYFYENKDWFVIHNNNKIKFEN